MNTTTKPQTAVMIAVGMFLLVCSHTAPARALSVPLQQATATSSQGSFEVGFAIDGIFEAADISGAGWANNGNPADAAFETVSDMNLGPSSTMTFTLFSGGFGNHTLGRFRLSVTDDDRSTFADGLASGGDVTANWTVLTPTEFFSDNPLATFTLLPDNSLLLGGTGVNLETYTVRALAGLNNITGIRLEMIADVSLPSDGPGRAANGNFVLRELALSMTPFDPNAVPEPSSLVLVAIGGLGLLRRVRRRQ